MADDDTMLVALPQRPADPADEAVDGVPMRRLGQCELLAVTRDNAVWRVPLTKTGASTKVGVFIQMSGGAGPDGMALDAEGNLAVAHVGLGTVWLFSALGEPIRRIRTPQGILATNCAFGGPDGRTLYVTESQSGTVLKARLDVPGQRLFSHS